MKQSYPDILKLTKKKPIWYDINGTPRYAKFRPEDVPSIYARVVVLLEITCQECGEKFQVGIYHDGMHPMDATFNKQFQVSLKKWQAAPQEEHPPFHYGDPPAHSRNTVSGSPCYAGCTMTSDTKCVLQYWEKDKHFKWKRVKHLEGIVKDV